MVNRFTDDINLSRADCQKLLKIFKAGHCFIDQKALLYTPMYKSLENIDIEEALVIANTTGVVLFSEFHQDDLLEIFYIRQKSGGAFSYGFH